MTSEEKPLHVRVAEALGCKVVELRGLHLDYPGKIQGPVTGYVCGCKDERHSKHSIHQSCCHDYEGLSCENVLAHFDTDWSATGPLIEKYGITLTSPYDFFPSHPADHWTATFNKGCTYPHYADPTTQEETNENCACVEDVEGATPLLAVCHLILALKEAGKL